MSKGRKRRSISSQIGPSLFPEFDQIEETTSIIRSRELELRSNIETHAPGPVAPNFLPLVLPYRWEALQAEADKRKVQLKPLISPVSDAILTVQKELRYIQETGMGKLFVISGITGSGKTTFLNSLHLFLENVVVHSIRLSTIDRPEVVENAMAALRRDRNKHSIVVLEGRETFGPLKSEEIDILLTTLNADFRRGTGRTTLFVIPTNYATVAQSISDRAATIGGMTSRSRPFYAFGGPPRNEYYTIADKTVRALNSSRSITDYGIAEKIGRELAEPAESIGAFLASCYEEIQKQRDAVENAANLIKRKRIHLWMIFCSLEENSRRNDDIIRSLTVGNYQHVQVQRILTGDSREARYWETRPEAFSIAADYLDLRIMYLPLRTANSIITAYGPTELKDHLKSLMQETGEPLIKREAVRARAQESIANTAIGAFLKAEGFIDRDPSKRGQITDKQKELFKEIVKIATKDDIVLNAAIAETLRDWLNNPDYRIGTEVKLDDVGSISSDIAVVTPIDIYCLEMKWRSSELNNSDIIREVTSRVKEFALGLSELKTILQIEN